MEAMLWMLQTCVPPSYLQPPILININNSDRRTNMRTWKITFSHQETHIDMYYDFNIECSMKRHNHYQILHIERYINYIFMSYL